jgi:hypothetical protein
MFMARILGIHGIAQQFGGGYQLEDVWYSAIRDGLVAADHPDTAEDLTAKDVRVAFFGDFFRAPGTMAVGDPPYSPADVRPGLERELLTTFFDAAVAQDLALGTPEGAMGAGKATVQVMLSRLSRSAALARVAQRAFIGNLKQVTAFLTDAEVKQKVLARVREQIKDDTRIVIGHSLGSVVAYEYLCHDRPGSVELLLTVGCPLGIPNVIFDKLTPAPSGGVGLWPETVADWVNVADPDDFVALRKDLAPLFPSPTAGRAVADRLVDNGDEPHAAERYLNSRQSGSAIADVLR